MPGSLVGFAAESIDAIDAIDAIDDLDAAAAVAPPNRSTPLPAQLAEIKR
jgi:hypothetical protein